MRTKSQRIRKTNLREKGKKRGRKREKKRSLCLEDPDDFLLSLNSYFLSPLLFSSVMLPRLMMMEKMERKREDGRRLENETGQPIIKAEGQ